MYSVSDSTEKNKHVLVTRNSKHETRILATHIIRMPEFTVSNFKFLFIHNLQSTICNLQFFVPFRPHWDSSVCHVPTMRRKDTEGRSARRIEPTVPPFSPPFFVARCNHVQPHHADDAEHRAQCLVGRKLRRPLSGPGRDINRPHVTPPRDDTGCRHPCPARSAGRDAVRRDRHRASPDPTKACAPSP